jgi:hypothetical protein
VCFICHARLDAKAAEAGRRISAAVVDALNARSRGIRLYWSAGWVSEFPDPLDEDTQAVSQNAETGLIVLHAADGEVLYFEDAHASDSDGFLVFREQSREVRPYRPKLDPAPRLSAEDCFAYTAVVPEVAGDWHAARLADDGGPNVGRRLVGHAPAVRLEAVGMLKGGGRVSALCDLVRPEVLATRVTLTASDPAQATARVASFHLDESLVTAFRPGDVIHLTRSPRGGLAMSVIRGKDLVVALGAVSALPLGELKATVRRDQVAQRIPPDGDDRHMPALHPVQITTADEVPRRPRGFTIRTWYGAWPSPHDSDECVSIVRKASCSEVAAFTSTLLLAASDALHVER